MRQRLDNRPDLHGQFARRREHEHAVAARGRLRKTCQRRQRERQRLARARLRDGRQVAPFQRERDGPRLNWRRFGDAL